MHRSVTHNGVVYLGGVVASDVSVGMEEQTRQVTERLDKVLAAAGTDKTQLLSATLYITDMGQWSAMNSAWLDWIADDDLPARAVIGVADLGEAVLIEAVVTASVGPIRGT